MDVRDPHERAGVVVLFRSVLTDAAGQDYADLAEEMAARAADFPGFGDLRDYTASSGERLAVIWWESQETLRAWREDVAHRMAQRLGRERWFAWFRLEVCDRVRASAFDRDA